MSAISNMVKNSNSVALDRQADIQLGFNGAASRPVTALGESTMIGWKTAPSNVLRMIVDNPAASIDTLGQKIYRQIYGDGDNASVHTMSERYSTIYNALKQYANDDGTMNSGKAQAAVNKISTKLVVQQARELTPEEAKAKQDDMAKQLASGEVQLSAPKKEKTEAEKQIAAQGGSTTQAIQPDEVALTDKSGKTVVVKKSETKITTDATKKAASESSSKSSSDSSKKKSTATPNQHHQVQSS